MGWYSTFSIGSTIFGFFVVFQSTVAVYFFFYTGDDLIPTYIKWMYKNMYKNRTKVANNEGGVHCRQKQQQQQQQQDRTNDDDESHYINHLIEEGNNVDDDYDCKNNSSAWSLRSHSPPGGVDNFKTDQELINNGHWQTVSIKIDEYSRLFCPLFYAIFVIAIWTHRY